MFIKTYSSSSGVQFLVIDPENLNLRCKVDQLGQLSCTLDEPDPEWQPADLTDDMNEDRYVKVALELIGKYAINIKPICEKLGLQIEGEGIERCRNFKHLIDRGVHYEVLDLSGLEIDCLPFQVGFFRDVKQLNLSGNKLRFLPPTLKCMQHLKVINLTGNPIAKLEFPDWFMGWVQEKAIEISGDETRFDRDDAAQIDDENDSRRANFQNTRPEKKRKWDKDRTLSDRELDSVTVE